MQRARDALPICQAGENLQTFLENGYLLCDQDPCPYLYSVETPVSRQTGVWAVTLFDDYLNNTIRKHEYTRVERENGIADYLRQTGIDANPVLIAYRSHPEIEEVIARSLEHPPLLSFEKGGKIHTLHAVREAGDIRLLIRYFGDLPASYLADGHHRAAALSSYGVERRKFDFKHSGNEEYNYFSSIYFSAGSLEIKPFQRLVNDLNGLTPGDFMDAISKDFIIEPVSAAPETGFPVTTAGWRPGATSPVLKAGHFGMYLAGHWYLLSPVESAGKKTGRASRRAK